MEVNNCQAENRCGNFPYRIFFENFDMSLYKYLFIYLKP